MSELISFPLSMENIPNPAQKSPLKKKKKVFCFFFLEKGRETHVRAKICCLLHAPYLQSSLQPFRAQDNAQTGATLARAVRFKGPVPTC